MTSDFLYNIRSGRAVRPDTMRAAHKTQRAEGHGRTSKAAQMMMMMMMMQTLTGYTLKVGPGTRVHLLRHCWHDCSEIIN
jgi:hypothetical protein